MKKFKSFEDLILSVLLGKSKAKKVLQYEGVEKFNDTEKGVIKILVREADTVCHRIPFTNEVREGKEDLYFWVRYSLNEKDELVYTAGPYKP